MKKLIVILFAFLTALIVNGQNVSIPDSIFKAYLVGNTSINTNSDSEIQVSEANSYAGDGYGALDISYLGIKDLKGIEEFKSISILNVSGNNLDTLNISQNENIVDVTCSYNNISELVLHDSLTSLSCTGNLLDTLIFNSCPNLTTIYCSNNQLDTLDVSSLNELQVLYCSENPNLNYLNLNNNTKLEALVCSYLKNRIDFTLFPQLRHLQYAGILDSVDVSLNDKLELLDLYNCNLLKLDVSKNLLLKKLYFRKNSISQINLNENNMLQDLRFDYNTMSQIDLSNNKELTNIVCDHNILEELDLSSNIKLEQISCVYNNITSLNFTNNPLLWKVWCSANNLEYLNLKNGNNTALIGNDIAFELNPNLFCVSVDDPVWSSSNWTNIDSQTQFSTGCCTNSDLMVVIDSVQNVSCNDSGIAYVHGSGGNSPYNYEWGTFPTQIDSIAKFDNIGIYSVTITDMDNCDLTKGVFVNGPGSIFSHDLDISLSSSSSFQSGLVTNIILDASNDGCSPVSGQIVLVKHGPLTFDSSSVAPDTVMNDTLVWNFSNWDYGSVHFVPTLYFRTDSSAIIGDWICFDVKITPTSGDADTSNNIKHYCYQVVSSYDPNDKQVYPSGKCEDGQVALDQKLTYTVRFQNTGNAPAVDIYILDTISSCLDISTLNVISQSHSPMITEIIEDSIIKFRFDNIQLADSVNDEPSSHGYVIYEITPKISVQDGDLIQNSAAIYFDLNDPVITNTVLNTLVGNLPAILSGNVSLSDCDSVAYNGKTYYSSQVINDALLTKEGCDSIAVIDITVGEVSYFQNLTNCDSLILNGNTYYSSQMVMDTLIAGAGCDSIVTSNVTINKYEISYFDTVITEGDSIFLEGEYQFEEGMFYDTIAVPGSCDRVIITHLNVKPPTGFDKINNMDVIRLYPNPNNGRFKFDVQGHSKIEKIQVYDIFGQQVDLTSASEENEFELVDKTDGLYILQIEIEGRFIFQRFMVK